MTAKPVVFLAFANDRERRVRYLRNLPEEARRLRAMLDDAQRAGLCELLVRQNLTREELFGVFQSAEVRDCVALFHYGGHANGYALLLEDARGGAKAAHAAGLAELLGAQHGLQLVFLNGCATGGQAQGLLDAGVAAVLVTSDKIKDEVALDFASHFYAGLGNGASLERAYAEAKAAVVTGRGAGPDEVADLYRSDIQTPPEDWPWRLYIREGAERVLAWSLPQAAGDPLFALPQIPPGDLPERPYRHLQPFGRAHAELFFGRGKDIRALYERLTDPQAAPILLLYGRSGVGKSSLLEAGLIPRLEQSHEVLYRRRQQDLGLWGTLLEALEADEETTEAAHNRWGQHEQQGGKPLDLILDQVEEVFTRPDPQRPAELRNFLDAVKSLLGDPRTRPRGKLVLGFRKEWLSELQQGLSQRELPYGAIPIEPLDRGGLIEAIVGPTSSQRLQQHYGLSIEDGLTEVIADMLRDDAGSPLAPTLQVLLAKLWAAAKDRDPAQLRFDNELYQALKREGLLLGDYLDQQLALIEKQHPQAVQSGLVLDLLAYHTTARGTSEERSDEDLLREYARQAGQLGELIAACQMGYLLLPTEGGGARLGHDTLAPLIRGRFEESDRPGQRARTILEGRAPDWAEGKDGAPLDTTDLEQVEVGLSGMRILSADEKRLVDTSRQERDRRARQRKRLRAFGVIGLIVVAVAAVVAIWQWWEADAARAQAEREARIAFSRQLTAQAQSIADEFPERAMLLAVESFRRPLEADGLRPPWAETLIRKRLAETGPLPVHFPLTTLGNTAVFGTLGHWLATEDENGVKLFDLNDPSAEPLALDVRQLAQSLSFDPKGRWIVTVTEDGGVRLRNLADPQSEPLELLKDARGVVLHGFDDKGRWFAASADSKVWLWDAADPRKEPLPVESGTTTWNGRMQGRWLVSLGMSGKLMVSDVTNPQTRPVELPGQKGQIYLRGSSPQGRWLVAMMTEFDSSVVGLWDLTNLLAEPVVLTGLSGFASNDAPMPLAFDLKEHWLAAVGTRGDLRVWDLGNIQADPEHIGSYDDYTAAVAIDPQGRWLATGHDSGAVRIVDLEHLQFEAKVLREHGSIVNSLAIDPQGTRLATGGVDGKVNLWSLVDPKTDRAVLRGIEGTVSTLAFDPTGRWLLANISGDFLRPPSARLWHLSKPETEPVALRMLSHQGNGSEVHPEFEPTGRWLAARERDLGGGETTMSLWEFANPEAAPVVLDAGREDIGRLVFDPEGRWLAAVEWVEEDSKGSVTLWDLAHPRNEPMVLRGHRGGVDDLAFDPLGRWLAVTTRVWRHGEQQRLILWSLAGTGTEPVLLDERKGSDISLYFHPKGRWLASTDSDGTNLWDLEDPLAEPVMLRGTARGFDPKGRWLATTRGWQWAGEQLEPQVWLWDAYNPASEPIVLPGDYAGFDPNGRWLATTNTHRTDSDKNIKSYHGGDLEVLLWDLENPGDKPLALRGAQGTQPKIIFGPRSRWLMVTAMTGYAGQASVSLWDLENPSAERLVIRGHEGFYGYVSAALFDRTGHWLGIGSGNGDAKVWCLDPPTEEPVLLGWSDGDTFETRAATLEGGPGDFEDNVCSPCEFITFDRKGRWIATATADGTVKLWELRVENLLRKACRAAGRNLTRREWRLFLPDADYRATCPEYPLQHEDRPFASRADAVQSPQTGPEVPVREESEAVQLEQSIAGYRQALAEVSRESDPATWATYQSNLGFALTALGQLTFDIETLNEAVAAYNAALEVDTRELSPLWKATIQSRIGEIHDDIGTWSLDTRQLEEAATAYRAALSVWEESAANCYIDLRQRLGSVLNRISQRRTGTERLYEVVEFYDSTLDRCVLGPGQREMVQSDLGTTLAALGKREGDTQKVNEGLTLLQGSLVALTREGVPWWWAATKLRLGNAFATLGRYSSRTEHLRQATLAYKEALNELHQGSYEWTIAQRQLGSVLAILGERGSDIDQLREAVIALRAAVEAVNPEQMPLVWAETQTQLGIALALMGERETGTRLLEEAVGAHRATLEKLTRDQVPRPWALAQRNLGDGLVKLGKREADTALIEEAIGAFRSALLELARGQEPVEWATAQSSLGYAQWQLGERESHTERLWQSVSASRAALEVFTPENAPLHWAEAQRSLGMALARIGERELDSQRLKMARKHIENAKNMYTEAGIREHDKELSGALQAIRQNLRLSAEASSAHESGEDPEHR